MPLDGTDAVLARLRQAKAATLRAAIGAVDVAGNAIFADSQELCPTSPTNEFIEGKRGEPIQNPFWTGTSGALRQSGASEPAKFDGHVITKRLVYTEAYAAAVHEVADARHGEALLAANPQLQIPNLKGRWKFLAIPFALRRAWAIELITRRVGEAIANG